MPPTPSRHSTTWGGEAEKKPDGANDEMDGVEEQEEDYMSAAFIEVGAKKTAVKHSRRKSICPL